MTSLRFWQSVLTVLWVGAIVFGGYSVYKSFWGEACSIGVQGGSDSCKGLASEASQSDLFSYDATSPLSKVFFERERPDLFK